METKIPILITLTGGTCSGKSYLLNFIRKEGHPCFISTTTRAPRKGEVEGIDYFFISDQESRDIESGGGFAELVTFRGNRYGVTKKEFFKKLNMGPAFLIVEPHGINSYTQPALNIGAKWLKYFVHTEQEIVLERFKTRFEKDMEHALVEDILDSTVSLSLQGGSRKVLQVARAYTDRLIHIMSQESKWIDAHPWTRVLNGTIPPERNLDIILSDIAQIQA